MAVTTVARGGLRQMRLQLTVPVDTEFMRAASPTCFVHTDTMAVWCAATQLHSTREGAGTGTYIFVPVEGLRHFLINDVFQQPATHYFISRELLGFPNVYDHHFLLEKVDRYPQGKNKRVVVKIIHKAEDDDPDTPPAQQGKWNAKVRRDTLDFVCNDDDEVLKVRHDSAGYITSLHSGEWKMVVDDELDYPTTAEERDDAILRAEGRLGETDYDLLKNCEFFVTEVLTGKGRSRQFLNVIKSASEQADKVARGIAAMALEGQSMMSDWLNKKE